jgi:hypothetical protein
MWGIFHNNSFDGYTTSNWSVNDMCSCAEWEAPMSTVGLFSSLPSGYHSFQWRASEFPWGTGTQNLTYTINPHSGLVLLSGGLDVVGGAVADEYPDGDDNPFNQWDYQVIGSSYYRQFPPTYEPNEMASSTFTLPPGHNGVVMFLATMRVQGDSSDQGGNVFLWLEIDGVKVGGYGVQQLAYPNGVSQRTIMAGYLSSEPPLSPGSHIVKVMAQADGDFKYVSAHKELLLVYFD